MGTISAHTMYLRVIGRHDGFHQNVASLIGALARSFSPILIIDSFSTGFLDLFWVPMSLYGLGLLLLLACKNSLEPHEMYNFNKHKQGASMRRDATLHTDSMATIHSFGTRLNNLENQLKPRGFSPGAFDLSKLQS